MMDDIGDITAEDIQMGIKGMANNKASGIKF